MKPIGMMILLSNAQEMGEGTAAMIDIAARDLADVAGPTIEALAANDKAYKAIADARAAVVTLRASIDRFHEALLQHRTQPIEQSRGPILKIDIRPLHP